MSFHPALTPPKTANNDAFWFVFYNGRLLVKKAAGMPHILETHDLGNDRLALDRRQYIGSLNGRSCYTADIGEVDIAGEDLELKDLRTLFGSMDEEIIWTAGLANQLATWNRSHQYCGSCGSPSEDKTDERAKICPQCGLINYPRLSPAVIVAVLKGDSILLARNKRFRLPFFSVLAGFVEPGETLEACVEREVEEEAGITVKNIRYFGSQPWPFPDSLMIAFLADYAGGEIRVDRMEIMEAGWFSRKDLPRIPPRISIARQLIDWFTAQNK